MSSLGQWVVDAWEETLRETPDHSGEWLFERLTGERSTYRERLDRQPYNWYGELIPRIVTVRRNLRRLRGGW
jgi:hypothetical protein